MRSTDETPPTTAERYSRAIGSSHLQLQERRTGDGDVIAAAGFVGNIPDEGACEKDWKRNRLGALLFRLSTEFDAARGEHSLVVAQISTMTGEAERIEKQGKRLKKAGKREEAKVLGERANAMRQEITRALMSERLFHMGRLKSMRETKEAMGEWVMERAISTRFKSPGPMPAEEEKVGVWRAAVEARAQSAAAVAGRVLDIFLDNLCAFCQARGFNGGFGAPPRICSACGGTGRRDACIGGDPAEEHFGHMLLLEVDAMLTRVQREMRRFLVQNEATA